MSAGTHFVKDLPEPSDHLLLPAGQPCSSDGKVTETLSEVDEIDGSRITQERSLGRDCREASSWLI